MSGKLCVSGAAGGGGTDGSAQPKTRTPHKDVGITWTLKGKKMLFTVHLSFLVVLTVQLNQTME